MAGLEAGSLLLADVPAEADKAQRTKADEINRRKLRSMFLTEKRLSENG